MNTWVVGTSNQLFMSGSYSETKFLKKSSYCQIFMIGAFALTILFALTLTSDMTVLSGNDAFLVLLLSTKKHYFSFLIFFFSRKSVSKLKY